MIAAAEHPYSVVLHVITGQLDERIRAFGSNILDEDLAEQGREDTPHITVKYGLHTDNPKDVSEVLADQPMVEARLLRTSVFPATDDRPYDVVKIDVEGEGLHALHHLLSDSLENTSTYPTYHPHITVAYVKAGRGAAYQDKDLFEGEKIIISQVVFRGTNNKRTVIELKNTMATETAVTLAETTEETTPEIEAGDPTSTAVHVDGLLPETKTEAKTAKKRKGRNPHFMSKLVSLLSGKYSVEEMAELVKTARAHAGGMTKAESAKLKSLVGEDVETAELTPKNMLNRKALAEMEGEGESLNDRIREVEAAFYKKYPPKDSPYSPSEYWCQEVWDKFVIARSNNDGELYQLSYEQAGDEIVFGPPIQVVVRYVPIKMNEVADMCAEGNGWRIFVEYTFAEPPEWMPLLPKPGSYQHPEYGEIKITKKRNENFINNFNKGVYQSKLPINTEHAPDKDGAYGWIEGLRLNDDGSVDARVKWSDRGTDAIRNDRFRYISAEWNDSWTDATGETFKDVLRGAALTVRPYFKDKFLRPLVAREAGLFALDEQPKAATEQVFIFSALPSAPAATLENPDKEKPFMPETAEKVEKTTGAIPAATATAVAPVVAAEAESTNAKAFAEMQAQITAMTEQLATFRELNENQNATIKLLTEQNQKVATAARTKRFTDEIKGRVEGGVVWHGDHDKHLAFLERLSSALGEDSQEIQDYIDQQRTVTKQLAESKLFDTVGSDASESRALNATEQIDALTKKKMSENTSLSYAEALGHVARENQALYDKHVARSTVAQKRRSSDDDE